MNYPLFQPIIHYFPLDSGIREDAGSYRDTTELTLFTQTILWICFYFSVKTIIFVGLFLYRKVFDLVYVPFDKRKYSAVRFKLHRLLYFTRAVGFPIRTGSHCVRVG